MSGDGTPGGHPLICRFSGPGPAPCAGGLPVSSTLRWRTLSLVNSGQRPKSMRCLSRSLSAAASLRRRRNEQPQL